MRIERTDIDVVLSGDSGGPVFGATSPYRNFGLGLVIGFFVDDNGVSSGVYMALVYIVNGGFNIYTSCGTEYYCP